MSAATELLRTTRPSETVAASLNLGVSERFLGVPMHSENELIGIVHLCIAKRFVPFTDKEIALVHELCHSGSYRYRERAVV